MSLVIKAVAVISEEMLLDAVPMAWELLLDHDNEVRVEIINEIHCFLYKIIS